MSGVNDDCYVRYYIQQQNILVYTRSGVKTMAYWWQLTQGGSVIKPKTDATVNQQLWEGPMQNYIILPRICERFDMRKDLLGFKKKSLGGFLSL